MASDPEPDPGSRPGPRVPIDRIILIGVFLLLLVFLGGYLLLRRAGDLSWPYVANSVLLSVLFLTNVLLVLTLVTVLMRNLIKALVERRRGILGSRFRTKLVFSLLLLWLVPSGIIFYAALNLIQRSIDRWFSVPAERLNAASQRIAAAYYDEARDRGAGWARTVAERLEAGEGPAAGEDGGLRGVLEEMRRAYRLDLVSIETGAGRPLRAVDPRVPDPGRMPDVPPSQIEEAFAGQPFHSLVEHGGGHLVRCGHPVRGAEDGGVTAVAVVGTWIPVDLAGLATGVTRSFEDYRQTRAQRGLIRRVYVLVFALITLVVLFSVTWIGLYLARRITEPIQSLAQGTRAIAAGDLDYRVEVEAGDELGILVASFNSMTADLKAGQELIERRNRELSESNRELMERRRYIETLLQNITAGVVSLDRDGRIATVNRAALRLLGLDGGPDPTGRRLPEVLPPERREAVQALVSEVTQGAAPAAAREIDLPIGGRSFNVAVSATALRDDVGGLLGAILVFDDLTDLMRAQKVAAWREVARRLAHEIKNPLTPIQLSAERIRKRHAERSPDFDEVVEEGTAAIVREVAALKGLVDEFTRFSRLPPPNLVPAELPRVVGDTLALYRGVHARVTIEPTFEPDLPRVVLDPEQMKRVLVNLLDNAVEAMGGEGRVTIDARRDPASGAVRLEVADEGPGIRPEDRDRLFLPYFSTKKKGTGLGLAIVHRIVTDHRGRIRVENRVPRGARFVIELPADAA